MLSTTVLPIGRYSFLYVILLRYNIYHALILFEKSNYITVLLYTVTDQDIAFLVPDSYRATVKNPNSISVDVSENIIKK